MSTPSAIRVTPVDDRLRPTLSGLHVLPAQRAWVGAIADLLADVAQCPASEPMAILLGDAPVGYYRIEPTARSVAGHDFDVPALGLRAFRSEERRVGTACRCACRYRWALVP